MTRHAPPEISSSGARILASGTVIPFQEPGDVAFEIGPLDERLAIILRFEDGPGGGPEPRVEVTRASARLIRLVVRNFGGPDGGGTTRPLALGALEGLKLWAHLQVSPGGPGRRALHYTFFLEGGDISLAETLLRPE